jgi:hypothetical protein
VIETISAFRRTYNRDELSEGEMNGLLGEFFREALEDFSSSRWRSRSSSSRST